MEEELTNLVQAFDRILKVVYEDRLRWMDTLVRDALQPESFFNYVIKMGLDLSSITERIGQPGGYDPYRVLGLEKTATDVEIRSRYRELLHKLHPDTAGVKGTSFLLQMVNAAYQQIATERHWSR